MTSRTRNQAILGVVLLLLVASAVLIATKPTRLGLDLKGGIELVYQGQPTPKVPKVTPQAIDDAIETIRKRTDVLGVSEPEIQRSGQDQISVGLPSVKNAKRAIEQVGSTAQLQYYDWEPNVLGRGPDQPYTGTTALYQAVKVASKQKPRAEATDIPPGGPSPEVKKRFGGDGKKIEAFYDRANDTSRSKFYLFAPDQRLLQGPDTSCRDLLSDYDRRPGPAKRYSKDSKCLPELASLGAGGPPPGSAVLEVPQGIVVIENPVRGKGSKVQTGRLKQFYVVEDDSELSGSDIKDPRQDFDQNNLPAVSMKFTDKGRKAFARATKREAKRGANIIRPPGVKPEAAEQHFAITLDNQIVSLPTISFVSDPEGIDGRTGAQITGLTLAEAKDLANNLRIGALPINLKLISQTQVSATLGKQALHQGLIAGAAGLILTILFLLLFYRVLGAVATVALGIYALLLFGLVKLIPITLTLPGIAGLVLTLAVAADANIVLYERIKEEMRAGRSIPAAIRGGYAKALKTIIDANVVTIGVAFILFMLATAGIKGFAFTLGVGTLVSLFTAVLATSAILGSMARSRVLRRPSALGAGKERVRWSFDFMGNSRWFFSMSGAIIGAGAIAISTLGINFGIDFKSGTRITTPLERPASVQQVRNVLSPLGYGDAKIQAVNDRALGRNVIQIATKTLQPAGVQKVESALDKRFGVRARDFSSSSIGPTFGAQIARTALIAIIASLVLISLYIGLRFQFKFAVPVLIALAHDLLITSGVYALTGREVTTSTVAALLTILGYSLYDTVIVFDRIRENVPRMPRATFSQIANRSMSEVLTRSLATSFAVLMPVGSLLVFGGQTLKDFAFALLVGVASGAYSSIFIATPVLTEWKEREPVYMRRRRMVMEEHGGRVPAYASATLGDEEVPAEAPRERRARRPGRRAARSEPAARGAGAPTEIPPPRRAEPAPPVEGAPAGGDGAAEAAPQPEREPAAADGPAEGPPPAEPEPAGARAAGPRADGGTAPARESRVTSTAGAGKPKPKRRNRPKKKHGRR